MGALCVTGDVRLLQPPISIEGIDMVFLKATDVCLFIDKGPNMSGLKMVVKNQDFSYDRFPNDQR